MNKQRRHRKDVKEDEEILKVTEPLNKKEEFLVYSQQAKKLLILPLPCTLFNFSQLCILVPQTLNI